MRYLSYKRTFFLLIIFLAIHYLIAYIATQTIPFLGYYSYPEMLDRWDLPWFVERFAGFDGLHYIKIALEGYARNATAFLPVFPLLMRFGVFVTGASPIVVGIVISVMALAITLYMLPLYMALLGVTQKQTFWVIAFFLFFPTSFFFQGVYTESVFVAILITALYMSKKKQYKYVALFGYLAGLTRITGFFLSIPFFLELIAEVRYKRDVRKYVFDILRSFDTIKFISVIAPVLGFGTFMGYLWLTTGDPLRLAHSQVDFNQNRSTSFVFPLQVVWRYLKIFYTADWTFQYFIAVVEFVLTSGVVLLLGYDAWNIYKRKYTHLSTRAGLNIFAWMSILLPISTGTLLSMPRFILPLIIVFIVLAEFPKRWMKLSILVFFSLLHIILLMAFIQGYFVS